MRVSRLDDVRKGNGYTIVLKQIKCSWGNGKTYQTRVYRGNRLVDANCNIDNYREAFTYYCEFLEAYGIEI